MKNKYNSMNDVMSGILGRMIDTDIGKTDRILKSTRLENQIFKELLADCSDLQDTQTEGQKQLSTFDSLTRDVFSAFYSLSMRQNEENVLTEKARQFNKSIMEDLLKDGEFNTIKSICEGRELPAFEACEEFSDKILNKLPDLLKAAGGNADTLNVIDTLTEQAENMQDSLQSMIAANEQAGDASFETKVIKAANKLDSKLDQIENLKKAVQDNLFKHSPVFKSAISGAAKAAEEKAQETADMINAWGDGSGNMGNTPVNKELLSKVRQNKKLQMIARNLGRYKELISDKRKNGFSYGLGEKYDITNGNNINLCLPSELALLATPETQALFVRKYQQKRLKQYRKREQVIKGMGDIIVCIDESASMDTVIDWAKAFALALLDIASRDNRKFAMIHFADRSDIKADVFEPGKYTLEDVIASAEHNFMGGGTDFEMPLTQAIILSKKGFENADITFITDGECAVRQEFADKFQAVKNQLKFKVTGILIDKVTQNIGTGLIPFCDAIYRSSELTENSIAEKVILQKAI